VARFTDTAALIRTVELGDAVADALGAATTLLLVNHGIVVVGDDLPSAVVRAVMLEDAARQQLLTQSFGGAAAAAPAEAPGKAEVFSARSDALWDYFVRELAG
jgi:L-fuculose-phosphate aldolase